MEIEGGSTRSHSVENSPSKRIWTRRKTDRIICTPKLTRYQLERPEVLDGEYLKF